VEIKFWSWDRISVACECSIVPGSWDWVCTCLVAVSGYRPPFYTSTMASNQNLPHHDTISSSSAPEERTTTVQDPSDVPPTVRTLERYVAAAKVLESALQEQEDGWRQFDFPRFLGEEEDSSDVDFGNKIDSTFYAWKEKFQDQTAWMKGSYAVKCIRRICSGWTSNVWWADAQRSVSVATLCLSGLS
jgi:hypothetical protein